LDGRRNDVSYHIQRTASPGPFGASDVVVSREIVKGVYAATLWHLLWQSSIVSVSTAEFSPNKTMGPNKTMDIGWEEIMQ
jgi:hypothetical protein